MNTVIKQIVNSMSMVGITNCWTPYATDDIMAKPELQGKGKFESYGRSGLVYSNNLVPIEDYEEALRLRVQRELDKEGILKVHLPKEVFMKEVEKVLESINYKVTKNNGQYLEAYSTHVWSYDLNCAISVNDKRKLNLNYDTDQIYFGIKEDWDTHTSFNGTIETLDDIIRIDKLTRVLPKTRVN